MASPDPCARRHEPLEASLIHEPQALHVEGWEGCYDLKLCMELANPWPAKVWTLFRIVPHDDGASFIHRDVEPMAEKMASTPFHPFYGDAERIRATGYAAPNDKDVVIVTMAPRESTGLAWLNGTEHGANLDQAPSFGWMYFGTTPDGDHHAVPALQAMLLPQRAEGAPGVLVVIGEHRLRLQPWWWDRFKRNGSLRLEVIQCVGLKVHGLELPLEDASPVEMLGLPKALSNYIRTLDFAARAIILNTGHIE